ncbi:ester cyclase [Rhizobium halophytocola]|uniref:Ester cyclase n=1 Tax=Rhizobium halophytocola TaxID=735519 RepID=A0ABS4DZH7_9HYPH|nr:ester cyclase [Rhizobium halophytocola]MBP1851088.1 putative ester cyclase [Rhizobium halophytocola]
MNSNDPKSIVRRFNKEVIEGGDRAAFEALMATDFINHAAPPGAPTGAEGMWNTFEAVLRPAIGGLTVEIHDQMLEGDKVTTRKTISGTHTGPLLGIPATGRPVRIEVIDIVRVTDGRYVEHWGINTLPSLLQALAAR